MTRENGILMSEMSAEWWKAEADRYCRLHIAAHQQIGRLEAMQNAKRESIYPVHHECSWTVYGLREALKVLFGGVTVTSVLELTDAETWRHRIGMFGCRGDD